MITVATASVPDRGRPAVRWAAFTLVELLVAATLALVVMAALASLFGIFGRAVADSQELVQLAARMRSTAWRLRQDLEGVTTDVSPLITPESACGYFQLIEGPTVETATAGDADDILMLTTATPGRPFTGLLSGTLGFESPVAEVAWFCKQRSQTSGGVPLFNLYRRQLLVAAGPGAGVMSSSNSVAFASWDAFYLNNDLSVRREGALLIANSLADLVRRQSRFLHNLAGATTTNNAVQFFWPQLTTSSTLAGASDILTDVREGEDLLLTNVIAFDVRVFDPQQPAGGGYVNLGIPAAGATSTLLSGVPTLSGVGTPSTASPPTMTISQPVSNAFPPNSYRFYDTWSRHTEANSVGDFVSTAGSARSSNLDRGTNWLDNNANGVVDDAGELEQPSPYSVPLRGVEIRIRCLEPSSQEVRQITVQHSFLAR